MTLKLEILHHLASTWDCVNRELEGIRNRKDKIEEMATLTGKLEALEDTRQWIEKNLN